MATGLAVVLPTRGGGGLFARHEQNCLSVDTSDPEQCYQALARLIDDHSLRAQIQRQAIYDARKTITPSCRCITCSKRCSLRTVNNGRFESTRNL